MSDILKVCPKCNADISSETGECFYCKPIASKIDSEKETGGNSNCNNNSDLTLFLVGALLINLPFSVIISNWAAKHSSGIFSPLANKYFTALFFIIYAILSVPMFAVAVLIKDISKNPRNAIRIVDDFINKEIFEFFKICGALIGLGLIIIFRLAFFILLVLLGLAVVVFVLKFIKSQLFN